MKDKDTILLDEAYTKIQEGAGRPITMYDISKMLRTFKTEKELNMWILGNFKNGYIDITTMLEYLEITQGEVFEALMNM